jgi:hypothetical protein
MMINLDARFKSFATKLASRKSGHVRYAPKAEVIGSFRDGPLQVDGTAVDMIQALKLEPRMMRYEISDNECGGIKPNRCCRTPAWSLHRRATCL